MTSPTTVPSRAALGLRRLAGLLLLLLVTAGLAAPARAQKPTPGEWYEELQELGFRVRSPKDWTYVPPQPGDDVMLAKYVPTGRDYLPIGGDNRFYVFNWILSFDLAEMEQNRIDSELRRRGKKTLEELAEEERKEIADEALNIQGVFEQWLDRHMLQGDRWERIETHPLRIAGLDAEEWFYSGRYSTVPGKKEPLEVRVYAALYEVVPGRHIVLVYNCTGEKGDWNKHEAAYRKMARSFDLMRKDKVEAGPEISKGDLRGQKRRELEQSIASMPGWWLLETENYFILTDSDDKRFVEEIAVRLEAIRDIYERDYPAEKARSVVEASERPSTQGEPGEEGAEPPEAEEEEDRTVAGKKHLELSRTSVVRICKDADMYYSYGGPGGSAGYWSSFHKELVLYDDRQGGGRDNTYAVLNHEAFHQYIYYFYGSLAPHSWYNEGTGDYYSGYRFDIKRKKFELGPFDWRTGTIKETLRQDNHVPLKQFVRWTQGEYYGNNDLGASGGDNYAQGWSFIFFLRHGKGKPKGWNKAWDGILDTYLDTLASTGDLDKAVDEAFKGVDWNELEECWIRYTE
jgi:hypothetical protein